LQPGLTLVHPVSGFHVDSVRSIADFAAIAYLARPPKLSKLVGAESGF
jgi:hypothetical protein